MQKFDEPLVNQLTGLPLAGISVTIQNYPSGATATIYGSNDVSSTPLTQPLTSQADGTFPFYAADGHYQIVATPPGGQPVVTDFLMQDITQAAGINVASQTHAAAAKTDLDEADEFPLADSAVSYGLKKIQWSDIKNAILALFSPSSGSSLIGFLQSGTGAVARTMQEKGREVVSVRDFGAVGDGVTDDTVAFQLTASMVDGFVTHSSVYASMPSAPFAKIFVPQGNYLITTDIDTEGKDIIWVIETGVNITGLDFLNGRVYREGLRINATHHGILDHACSFAINAHRTNSLGKPAGIFGITHPNQLSSYSDRDSVGLYFENKAAAPVDTCVGSNYTASTLIPVTPVDVTKLRIGMIIDTAHSPNKYSGVITEWASDGTQVTVSAWYEVTGTTGVAGTPPNGVDAYINPFTKAWAGNAQIELDANSIATRAVGMELGCRNSKTVLAIGDADSATNYVWGYDAVSFGPNYSTSGFIARGGFLRGFHASGNIEAGISVTARNGVFPVTGFESRCDSAYQINCMPDGVNSAFNVRNSGTMDIGSSATAASRFIRLRSSGLTADYDARILWSGGSASTGQGTLRFTAATLEAQGVFRPYTDNSSSLGGASNRWTTVYATTGTIDTSDAREKQDIYLLDEAEKRVALSLKKLVKKFRFKTAVQEKGADARIHVGVIAQEVISAFAAEGLNAHRYGILCYDEWEEQIEKLDVSGEVLQEQRIAGDMYGIRYNELLAFVIAAL